MLSNRSLVLGSAALVAVVVLVLSLGGGSGGSSGDLDGSVEILPPEQAAEAPRVVSVEEYVSGLTPTERTCFNVAVGEQAAAELAQGATTITEAQLGALSACVNPTLPNAAGVVQ